MDNHFYNSSDCVIVVFDLNHYDSFKNARNYLIEAFDKGVKTFHVLFGNKSDLEHLVSDEISDFVNQYNIKYFEVSVKNGF